MTARIRMLAAAGAGAVTIATAGTAGAQVLGADHWYAKGFGGATFPQEDSTALRSTGGGIDQPFNLDYDTGFTLGAALGANFTPNFALELEYAYRRADIKEEDADHVSSNAVMLNALYYFNPMGATGAWQPYVGGGVGWTNIDLATDDFGDFKRDNAIGYQAIAGVAYNISPAWSVNGEVRWFGTDSGHLEGSSGGRDFQIETTFDTIDVLVGATYHF